MKAQKGLTADEFDKYVALLREKVINKDALADETHYRARGSVVKPLARKFNFFPDYS